MLNRNMSKINKIKAVAFQTKYFIWDNNMAEYTNRGRFMKRDKISASSMGDDKISG